MGSRHGTGGRASRGRLERLALAGTLPGDSEDERLRKGVLTLSAALITSLAFVWVGTYWALGLHVAALIPLGYQIVVWASLAMFIRTKRYRLFRSAQLLLMLLLPFLLQWSLGGFVASSAVMLWAVLSPLGALMFIGTRQAVPWLVAFLALTALSGAMEPALDPAPVPAGIVRLFFALNLGAVSGVSYALLHYFVRERERAQARSERLLLNVLPAPIAERLKREEGVIADRFDDVTVLFADIVEFTPLTGRTSPEEVVRLLDEVFTLFDRLASERGLEKIKTVGDAYMVAGGIPVARPDHAEAVADMALAMRERIGGLPGAVDHDLRVRFGMETGAVVAGVIGRSKFIYDLWGEAVNVASRMESHGVPGEIQVTERVVERLRDRYVFRSRGRIDVKGMGPMSTSLLVGPRVHTATPAVSRAGRGRRPS